MAGLSALARKMRAARKKRKWTVYQASVEMGDVHPHTITSLEGRNPDRSPKGPDTQVRTVVAVIETYWPDIELSDFVDSQLVLEVEE